MGPLAVAAALLLLSAAPVAAGGARERRGFTALSPGGAHLAAPARDESVVLQVESGPVAFENVIPETDSVLTEAVEMRVFSPRDWILRLLPDPLLLNQDTGAAVPISRLGWRTAGSGGYAGFSQGLPVTVAHGSPTSGAGARIAIDLRLRLADTDPLGRYAGSFQVVLEPR